MYEWQAKEQDQVAADWLLEHGYTPERVKKMMTVELLEEAFKEIRPLCDWCGEPGTRHFNTEGDGRYWLCDRLDGGHSVNNFIGPPIAQPALREYLGTEEPEFCDCVNEGRADGNCELCEGVGWFIPALDTVP